MQSGFHRLGECDYQTEQICEVIDEIERLSLGRVEIAALKTALSLPKLAVNDLVYQEDDWLPLKRQMQGTHLRFRCQRLHSTDLRPSQGLHG